MPKKVYYILVSLLLVCAGCQFKLAPDDTSASKPLVSIARYDQLEYRYLTTGDFSALQEMNTEYPIETRTLIEDVVKVGDATDPGINSKLLKFYQDTTLQSLIAAVEAEYADIEDLDHGFSHAFAKLKKAFPDIRVPRVYTQISALDQSVVVGNGMIGISLDKYLGEDYPAYKRFYTVQQRRQMNRRNILPDCLTFFMLSEFQLDNFELRPQVERDLHMGKLQWVANQILGCRFYTTKYVASIDHYMRHHPHTSYSDLVEMTDFSQFKVE